jgi:hypothetical protein
MRWPTSISLFAQTRFKVLIITLQNRLCLGGRNQQQIRSLELSWKDADNKSCTKQQWMHTPDVRSTSHWIDSKFSPSSNCSDHFSVEQTIGLIQTTEKPSLRTDFDSFKKIFKWLCGTQFPRHRRVRVSPMRSKSTLTAATRR